MASHDVSAKVIQDATKERIEGKEALPIIREAKKLVALKGKKRVDIKLADATDEEVLEVALGPTGNLRAPSFKRGSTFVVGFQEEAYDGLF